MKNTRYETWVWKNGEGIISTEEIVPFRKVLKKAYKRRGRPWAIHFRVDLDLRKSEDESKTRLRLKWGALDMIMKADGTELYLCKVLLFYFLPEVLAHFYAMNRNSVYTSGLGHLFVTIEKGFDVRDFFCKLSVEKGKLIFYSSDLKFTTQEYKSFDPRQESFVSIAQKIWEIVASFIKEGQK